MAEEKKQKQDKEKEKKADLKKKEQKQEKEKKQHAREEELEEILVRICGYDIPGSRNLFSGLTRIKGVSWSIANAACVILKIPRDRKISTLTKEEISKIEHFLKNPSIQKFLMNRRFDRDTGETRHYVGTELDIKKDFDIRNMKRMRSYKGVRHTAGQPVRGQRTRSHFRSRGKAVGVKRRKEAKTK